MIIIKLIKVILGILPFVALCKLNAKLNLKRINRGKQFLMPIIALVYCILAVIFLEDINGLLYKLAAYVVEHISFLSSVNVDGIMIYISNSALVLGFIAVKSILLPVLSKLWSSKSVMEKTSGYFYESDEETGKWLLKKDFTNFRSYFKGFYYGLFAVTLFVFVLSRLIPDSIFFQAVLYPFFGVIVLREVVSYLNGLTKAEFAEDIMGEDEESRRVANYGMLREILRNLFGSRVLYDNTTDNASSLSSDYDAIQSLSDSEDSTEKLVGKFFAALKESGTDVDVNYVDSCINLMKGKSTLFGNPFYRDLTDYILLPLSKSLIKYKKCLVVMGRDSATDDVKQWLEEGIIKFTGTNDLWKTEILDGSVRDVDIGILRFCDLYNLGIHKANSDFLSDVGFVIIVEPSRILSTGQIGLSQIIEMCENDDKDIVYCCFDRNCDGLVDSLSHILRTSITEVTATVNSLGNCSSMFWNADGEYMHHKILPNVSRYLGVGTEINAVAMKYQLSHTEWAGSEKFPVIDMKWIDGQYYRQISAYSDIPASQDCFNRVFGVNANIWNYPQKDNVFIVVEDEFQNLFEMSRVFSSRGKEQSFVNVISENYILRDYMIDNASVFGSDPKAIPAIVPDYARSERNAVLKLLMMMLNGSVREDRIAKELMLCGISFTEPYEKLKELILKHCTVKDPSLTVVFKEEMSEDSLSSRVVKQYYIDEANELYRYLDFLRNAYYIAEDEEDEKHYIGSRLYGHVFQSFLPGQYMTVDGKYYEVQTVTCRNGVVLRRAADFIYGRHYYKQLRTVTVSDWCDSVEMGDKRRIEQLEVSLGFANVSVETSGYYDMSEYGNFKNSKKVLINNIPTRSYVNKSVLKIRFPEADDKIMYTICLVLNEIFRTTYPNSYQYVSALSSYKPEGAQDGCMYDITGDIEKDCIYIIEDSDIDLGLIVSVQRNLKRYLETVTDYLVWHNKKVKEPPVPEEPEQTYVPVFETDDSKSHEKGEKSKNIFKRIGAWFKKVGGFIKSLFKKKVKEPDEPAGEAIPPEENVPPEPAEEPVPEVFEEPTVSDETTEESIPSESSDETVPGDEESSKDKSGNDSDAEEKEVVMQSKSVPFVLKDIEDIDGDDEELIEKPAETDAENEYMKHCFLKFGYESINPALDTEAAAEFLSGLGFDNNSLTQARECGISEEEYERLCNPQKYGVHICDFCGCELIGGEYDVLKDGRERCNRCSLTAVKTADDFRKIFKSVLNNMEMFYGIKINTAVKVRMTDAKAIAKHTGTTFVATPDFDGRTLGFAQKDSTGYSIYVENGSPRLAAMSTIAHELTHIWQYLNWNDNEIVQKYGAKNQLEVYEGMAKWAEIQFMILLNEKAYAKRQEIITRMRDDEYGRGFIKYAEKYPLSYKNSVNHTPFNTKPPL